MNDTILKIEGLTKKYGTKTVLDDVSFEIEKGKIYGFIGENGAGKTTTIRAVTGLSSIDEGYVELFGKSDKNGLIEARRRVGCLVEHPILDLKKSARANLKYQQLLYGNNDPDRISQVLKRVGLGDVKNKKAKDFSLGMKQRLGIAMALIKELRRFVNLRNLASMLVINLVYGISNRTVSLTAHAGGLIAGTILAYLFLKLQVRRIQKNRNPHRPGNPGF